MFLRARFLSENDFPLLWSKHQPGELLSVPNGVVYFLVELPLWHEKQVEPEIRRNLAFFFRPGTVHSKASKPSTCHALGNPCPWVAAGGT